MNNDSYTYRLIQCYDLIETYEYKILINKEHVDASHFFQVADPGYNHRGHSIKFNQSINQSINQKRIRVTKVTNVTARRVELYGT